MRHWDYGEIDEQHPCLSILEHAKSNTGICNSEKGFGPTYPWGLVALTGDKNAKSMGMDSGWFPCFIETFFNSFASTELNIWRVFESTSRECPGTAITDEDSWEATWTAMENYKKSNQEARYSCSHSIDYKRSKY